MLYNYLITAYKVLAGLVTPERLIGVALGTFGIYLVWIAISLVVSFQRKFNSGCQELINIVVRTKDIDANSDVLNMKTTKISSGFGFGWKKFKDSPTGKPSDFISRREALDVEINGGVLNQGKTFMRAYIALVTVVLFIFNFAYIGGENAITFVTFAESLILPFVFYVVIKLFYFLHNSIRQKLYRMDIESFYEVLDLLDSRFAKKGKYVVAEANDEDDGASEEEKTEEVVEEPVVEEPAEPENALDKYDVFKKKNIDVSKLMNETPQADSSLPFINVDSDYVIKDDDKGTKQVNQDSATSVLGGMMQNVSSKKSTYLDIEKNVAKIDNEKIEQLEKQEAEAVSAEKTETESAASGSENLKIDTENDIIIPNQDKFIEIEENDMTKPTAEEPKDSQEEVAAENTDSETTSDEDELEKEKNNIASVVSSFKANRPKLGGVVIEKNQPIAKRERTIPAYEEANVAERIEPRVEPTYSEPVSSEISKPAADENTDTILNTLKSMPGGYDNFPSGQSVYASTNYGTTGYDQNYGYTNQPMYGNSINQPMQGYGYNQPMQGYGYNQQPMPNYSNFNQNAQSYNNYVQDDDVEETASVAKEPKKKVVRTKENEPRPRNLRSSAQKNVATEDDEVSKRGRPKKQEVSESMTIKNDAEFNDVLARAEKLMRKSEEGLSESQSKRIEKELKILMDAMSRYKENK